ncbi:hypothetical protein KHA80_07120 [Anaerobacillus sp. HL2]|nr:hypothetical protein KHA80_07120 [Anaerobacillus sp. HL2]
MNELLKNIQKQTRWTVKTTKLASEKQSIKEKAIQKIMQRRNRFTYNYDY